MHCTDSKYIKYTIHDVDELGYDTTPLNVIKLDIFPGVVPVKW